MLGKKKIPGWMVAAVLVVSISAAFIAVPMIAKYNMQGCRTWIDSESYSPEGDTKILITSRLCSKDDLYERIIYLPPVKSPFGEGPRNKINLYHAGVEDHLKRAPALAVIWKNSNEIIVRHEPSAEVEYEPGENPTVLVSFETTDHRWVDRNHRQHSGGSAYEFQLPEAGSTGTKTKGFSFPEAKVFGGLTSVKTLAGSGKVFYDPKISKLIQKKEQEFEYVLETKIDRKINDIYVLAYSEGMSMDPGYMIYKKEGSSKKRIGGLAGEKIYIPGNGSIYIKNSYNTMFTHRNKVELKNGKLEYVNQPYLFAGMSTETAAFLTIYDKVENGKPIAVLPKGTQITIVLAKGNNYLLKTPFGLLGWVTVERSYFTPIKGLVFHGD